MIGLGGSGTEVVRGLLFAGPEAGKLTVAHAEILIEKTNAIE